MWRFSWRAAAGDIGQLDSLRYLGLFAADVQVPLLVQAVQLAVQPRTLDLSQSGLTGTFPSWLITALLDAPTNVFVNLTVLPGFMMASLRPDRHLAEA